MSEFVYAGSTQAVSAFSFASLYDYIQDTRKKLQEPLTLPQYAAAGEAGPVQKVSEIVAADPYRLRTTVFEAIKQSGQNFLEGSLRPVPYQDYPELYRAAQFTMAAAKEFADLDVLIQIYQAKAAGDLYQAMAVSYLNTAWIFVSEHFFMHANAGMLRGEEICFLLGHELGHAQCRHHVIQLLTDVDLGSNIEYSADRAGLIVCAKWLLAHEPAADVRGLLHRAVLSCVATLDKLRLAYKGYYPWQSYPYDELEGRLQSWLDDPGKLPPDQPSHPCDERRALALYHFGQSELLRNLLELEKMPGLLTDSQLQQFMNTLLKK